MLDAQLCFMLTMLVNEHLMEKVDKAENGDGSAFVEIARD